MIALITGFAVRYYTDNQQWQSICTWVDHKGQRGRTEGLPHSTHMRSLMDRARRQGVTVDVDIW